MATLVQHRKRNKLIEFLVPRGTGNVFEWLSGRILAAFFIVVIGGLVASATGTVAYLFYSGFITQAIARILVTACLSVGNCGDFSALLSGLAAGVMILAVIAMTIISSVGMPQTDERPDPMSQATLLLNWYCLSPQSRELLLTLLETSEAEIQEDIVTMLRYEHKAMQDVMHGGG